MARRLEDQLTEAHAALAEAQKGLASVKAAAKAANIARAEASAKYYERSEAQHLVRGAENSVHQRDYDIRELKSKIVARDLEKKAVAEAPKDSLLSAEFEAKAKAARAKLRKMIEDRLISELMEKFDEETAPKYTDKETALALLDELISQCEMRAECLRDEIAAENENDT